MANGDRFPGFGGRLRERLAAAGYGTSDKLEIRRFCRDHDFLTQSVYQWLGDKGPSPANLQKLAAVFGVTRGWLLFGDETAATAASTAIEHAQGGGRRPVQGRHGPLPTRTDGRSRPKASGK